MSQRSETSVSRPTAPGPAPAGKEPEGSPQRELAAPTREDQGETYHLYNTTWIGPFYTVNRVGLRWRILRQDTDGRLRSVGSSRFWRYVTALRIAADLQTALHDGASHYRATARISDAGSAAAQ